jgi:nicotinic acid mononucleotide adenylyltransferase
MPDPYWQLLGIDSTEDRTAIDSAYRNACGPERSSAQLHFAWKLLRDPYYRAMYGRYKAKEAFKEAGFFDDGLDAELDGPPYSDHSWLTTPYHKVLRRLHQLDDYDPAQLAAYPPIVLLTTGGFSPIHNGHIDMMELAKNEMVQQGHVVLGGYVSPSHDSYVSTKHDGLDPLLDEHRIRLCHEAVATSEWIMVDPWEARYLPRAVNFTDVIVRLERYLNHHLRLPVPLHVGYVFGGDNSGFARAFIDTGFAVCIERPGYEAKVARIQGELANAKERIVFARPRLEYFHISSSRIRAEEMVAMPEKANLYYCSLKENVAHAAEPIARRRYIIRDESAWAVRDWCAERDTTTVADARHAFLNTLANSLSETCSQPPLPDKALDLQIEIASLDRQIAFADTLRRETMTINLDNCTDGTCRVEISRLFGLADGQCFSTQVVPRPGFAGLTEQVRAIPPGEYELIDDDIASGRTMRMVMAVFPPGIHITRVRSLLEQTRSIDALRVDQVDYEDFYDVVDFRDFLLGSRNGGLVTRLPNGELGRVPYMAPYVTLSTRIRMPASREIDFSRTMWEANERFFERIEPTILVSECDPASQKLLLYLGFQSSAPVLDVVRWHLDRLVQSTKRY